jgi:serine/threonine-protein kinase HipA
MVARVDVCEVRIWNQTVGAATWLPDRDIAVFEFDRKFLNAGLDIAPLTMPVDDARQGDGIYRFENLSRGTFWGLPGLLADCLPDKFGNKIIDYWLTSQNRDANTFSPIERLCYTGTRGMGALEFSPPINNRFDKPVEVAIEKLVELTQKIVTARTALDVKFSNDEQANADAMLDILRVGTSAGGARAKAIIAMNEDDHVISGQAQAPEGYDYYLLKFDGVTDLELGKTQDHGRIEYAYFLMAQDAGINMSKSRLFLENGRAHFMTQRFDRVNGRKIHMQSLCGLAHYDFNIIGGYGYEQVFAVMRQLRLPKKAAEQQFRRMVFNVIARNHDDHTKNIGFLMNEKGEWSLSPAYDISFSFKPGGQWTDQHQMMLNGKRDHFTRNDLLTVARSINLPNAETVINEISDAVKNWNKYATLAGVQDINIRFIASTHRFPE